MGRAVTIELPDEIQDGFEQHDVTSTRSHFAEDCEWLMARGSNAPKEEDVSGRRSAEHAHQQIPHTRWEEKQHWIVDETKALSDWVVRGKPEGGEPFEHLGCDLW